MNKQVDSLSSLKRARRAKIVEAALRLFSARGFRGTTMEAIASEVGMSKVTVYGYFPDKDAVFEAVAEHVAETIRVSFREALEAPSSDLTDQLIGALLAKHSLVRDVVRASAFSDELFKTKTHLASGTFRKLDRELEAMLAKTLKRSGQTNARSKALARLLFGASNGIANRAADLSELSEDLKTLVQSLDL